ncbi:RHS repeat-associated core domain-containing protein, partial [bacterium]|nr:RHS repeat-associated core domain-containing protein [bacterium]
KESELGLYYYVARWYDPALGRFIQADSIVPGAGNPQAWDRYAYVQNNPILYTDPSGYYAVCDDGKCPYYPPKPSRTPDYVKPSELTQSGNGNYGGQDAYDLYLQLFYNYTGWWWSNGHFTLQDFFALIFYREGDFVLGKYGQTVKNGYTLVGALGEGASRAYYGWCLGEGSSHCGTPGTKASYLNWAVRYSGSLTGIITATRTGNAGSDLATQFHKVYTDSTGSTAYSADNASQVAHAFFYPDDSWKVRANQSAGKPYGWGNDLIGAWLSVNVNQASMVIWSFPNFFIPTYEGWQNFN